MRAAAVMVGVLLLAGCTPHPIAYQCPKIQLPDNPKLAIDNLKSGDKPDVVVKAMVSSIIALKDWNSIVRKQVNNS